MTYTVPKKVFSKNSVIQKMEIHFLNGDFVTIRKNEICNISIAFYDMLFRHKDKLYPIARNGFVKLRIQDGKAKHEKISLHNEHEYKSGRKSYIEHRCLCEEPIKFIKLYNQNNWSDNIYGDIQVVLEGYYLFLKFKPNDTLGPWESDEHFVNLAHPSKDQIFKMRLDFENCDGIDVYNSEIIDMNLAFDKRLEWISSGYTRTVRGGFIKIKLSEDFDCRYFNIFNDGKRVKLKHLERRICGNGRDSVDICNLYLDFYCGYELSGEHICVDSIYRTYDDRLDPYADFDSHYYDSIDYEDEGEDDDDDYYECFESGFAQRLDDGSIKIVFGKP